MIGYKTLKKCEELLPLPIEKALDKVRLYLSYYIWKMFYTGSSYIDYSKVKRVVVLNSVALGDNLIRTATVEAIARVYGKVDIIVPTKQTKRIWEGNPYVKNIYTIDNPPELKEHQLAVVINYGDKRFMDLIKNSNSGIKSIGLPYVNPFKLFGINVVLPPKPNLNQMDNMLRLAKEVGVDLSQNYLIKTRFFITSEDELNAKEYLEDENIKDNFIILNLGASNAHLENSSRWWPDENWKSVINYTLKKYPDMSIVINSSNAKTFPIEGVNYFNGDLGTLAALIRRARMVVQLNTGVGHLAAAVETPVITLIGFTDTGWAPWTLDGKSQVLYHPEVCTNCNNSYCKKKTRECMTTITPEEVVVAMEKILEVKKNRNV
jgi:ADP-heptose:LPS heptosyltransferase